MEEKRVSGECERGVCVEDPCLHLGTWGHICDRTRACLLVL
jgi:hypothetical protein